MNSKKNNMLAHYSPLPANILPAVKNVRDSLLDNRSLYENELKQLLNQEEKVFDSQRASELVNALLKDFENDADDISPNTWASIVNNWRIFDEWCKKTGVNALPASVPTFINFLDDKAKMYKPNSLQVYRWAVHTMHLAAGLPSPTEAVKVKFKMKGIKAKKAASGEMTTQATAFREIHLNALDELMGASDKLIDLRDLALMTMAYETLLRESELARIEFKHIDYQSDGRAVIMIPFTKTNQSGENDTAMISSKALTILDKYMSMAGLDESEISEKYNDEGNAQPNYIFKKLLKSGKLDTNFYTPLSGYSIDKIFNKAHKLLKLHKYSLIRNSKPWSGHSARVGACQDLLAAGYSPLEVQQSGRWSSIDMVYRYGRVILASESAMAKARNK
jgi:integrase